MTKSGDMGGEAPATAAADPLVGATVSGRFRVESLLSRGGMGKVYRAEQMPLGRQVALKVLDPDYAGRDPEFAQRFFLEAATSAKLTHPNTVTVFDYGQIDDESFFIAMELLEGRDLKHAIRSEAPFAPGRALFIAAQICRSLREAHELGVVHRDLKPANIFLVDHGDETDHVKVLDFGLAKPIENEELDLTRSGMFVGSPRYMAPEQIRGLHLDGRTDIYGLGVILYEMLAGVPPFAGNTSMELCVAQLNTAPPPMKDRNPECEVPRRLEQLVLTCLAKDPQGRFDNMEGLLAALRDEASALGLTLSGDGSRSGIAPQLRSYDEVTDPSFDITLDRPVPPRRLGPYLLAGFAGIAVVIGGVFMLMPPDGQVPEVEVHSGAPGEATAEATPDPGPALPIVSITTHPPGAIARVGDTRLCGPTPCEASLPMDPGPGGDVEVRVSLEGYRDAVATGRVQDGRVELATTLEKVSAPTPPAVETTPTRVRTGPRRPPKPRVTPPKHEPAPPEPPDDDEDGYKDNPY